MKYYRLLEHTADLGIRVWGKDLKELFVRASSAMYELITEINSVRQTTSVEIKVNAQDIDELLKNWLSELLYYFHVKEMLFSRFIIKELTEQNILSVAKGEKINLKRHKLKHEIKAVTFHNLKIKSEDKRFITDIIFDT